MREANGELEDFELRGGLGYDETYNEVLGTVSLPGEVYKVANVTLPDVEVVPVVSQRTGYETWDNVLMGV